MSMRICMICSCPLPPQEGIGFYVWNLSRYLTSQGHNIQIVTRGSSSRPRKQVLNGITIWRPFFLPIYPFHVRMHGIFLNRIVGSLEDETDVFHVHSPLIPVLRTLRPIVVTVHTPMLSDVRAIPARNLPSILARLQLPFSVSLEKKIIAQADRVSTVSTSVAQELSEYGVEPGDVCVMGNGVDIELFKPDTEESQAAKPYILTVGRLGLRKGLEDLINAAHIVASRSFSIKVLIAGAGPLEGMLRKRIRSLGLDGQVIMLGHISNRKELAHLFRHAMVFVHPAHYEGLPTVVLEAMSCGRPVIATAVSGALDVIKTGDNGLLIPPHDPSKMAEAILKLVRNPKLRKRLGHSARESVVGHYSWRKISSRYLNLYEEMLLKS